MPNASTRRTLREQSSYREKDVPMNRIDFDPLATLAKSRASVISALCSVFLTLGSVAFCGFACAHHPDAENQRVIPRIDLIGPIGSRLPPSYRRTYNRPTYLGGKIAYLIAPSSQEAMAWHRAEHAGAYKAPKKHQRLEQHYFYPKPWEVLTVGPRRSRLEPAEPAPVTPGRMIEMMDTEARELEKIQSELMQEPEFGNLEIPVEGTETRLAEPQEQEPASAPRGVEAGSPSDATLRSYLDDPNLGLQDALPPSVGRPDASLSK
jgi:hypothetical protein